MRPEIVTRRDLFHTGDEAERQRAPAVVAEDELELARREILEQSITRLVTGRTDEKSNPASDVSRRPAAE
jgi:hypothetical protein